MAKGSGNLPEYGAIFIANRHTRKECLDRHLFGSPSNSFPFVKEVKAGMILFLFEYETRKLSGVFEATTDGSWNIIPKAYQQVAQSYPSQVRFKVLWRCKPLSEHEFCDAIKENYFAPKKFNLGLSKDQVEKLLNLFYSRNVVIDKSLTPKKEKGKQSESFDRKNRWGVDDRPSLEEGEIENSAHSIEASVNSSTLILPKKKVKNDSENKNVSSSTTSPDLLDFIPLPSPDHDDLAETETGTPEKNHSESARVDSDHEDSIIPKVLGAKESKNKPEVKGLYADSHGKRECVFSRLNLMIKKQAEEDIKKGILKSPDEIMRKLQRSQKSWKRQRIEKEEEKKEKDVRKKASAFSRLTVAPERTIEKKRDTKRLEKRKYCSRGEEKVNQKNEKRRSVFLRLQMEKNGNQTSRKSPPLFEKAIDVLSANPSEVKEDSCGYLYNEIPSEESFAGKEKGEKGSTENEISNVNSNAVSQMEVAEKIEEVVASSPKPFLTYFRRRGLASPVDKETKLSVCAGAAKDCGGKNAGNGISASENMVCV